jgi:hypothetical protein
MGDAHLRGRLENEGGGFPSLIMKPPPHSSSSRKTTLPLATDNKKDTRIRNNVALKISILQTYKGNILVQVKSKSSL